MGVTNEAKTNENSSMTTVNRAEIADLRQISNVGPSIAAKLRQIDISSPHGLVGKDPYAMFEER